MQGHFAELARKHEGVRIVVMGGAPSLKADLDELEFDVCISANAHGVEFVKPDYLLAMDERNSRENCEMGLFLRGRSDAPVISPHKYADYRLSNWPQNPRFVLSGMIGAWMAWFMGAKVVILAGMDGYAGQSGYKDEARKIDRDIHCPVRVVSGPLTNVWPQYSPSERFETMTSTAIDGWLGKDGLITVRARKECLGLKPGETGKFMRHECARMLRHRMCEEIAEPKADATVKESLTPEAPADEPGPQVDAPPAKKRGRKSKKVNA